MYWITQCYAEHAPSLPSGVKRAARKSAFSDKALRAVEEYFFKKADFKSMTGTTQAIDLTGGGVKTNALPEQAWAVVNHRIATERWVFNSPAYWYCYGVLKVLSILS
jgi:Gly-Xaa carboxypeptidase